MTLDQLLDVIFLGLNFLIYKIGALDWNLTQRSPWFYLGNKKICGSTHLCRPAQVIHLSDSCPEGRVETLLAIITEDVFERRSLCRSNVVIVKGCKLHMGSWFHLCSGKGEV